MVEVTVDLTDDLLERFGNMAGALGEKKARVAFARAVNRTTNSVAGRVIKAIVRQSSIPRAEVVKAIRVRLAAHNISTSNPTAVEGRIWASGMPLSLKAFKPKQFKPGTRAKVWGKHQMYPHTFMGPRPGVKAGKLQGHVFVRVTGDRLPIQKVWGPSVPQEMVRDLSAKIFHETVAEMLPQRVEHELSRMLPNG